MLDKVEQRIHGRYVAVRTIVRRAVAYDSSCLEYAWKVFVLYADGRVGFIVFQQYIVAGLILFNEVVFQ